jgi:type I restriction enzyme S subunit
MTTDTWPLIPLGELTENLDGRRVPVKGPDRKPGPYPYYGASGIVDHVNGYLFDGEYLLIGEDGENLRTRQTPIAFMAIGKFWVNNHAHIVRGNERADTRFLCYALSQTDIGGYLTGSTMPKLTQGNLNRIPVIAPPLPEQKAIAAVLGAFDDKIELNRRMNVTLETMAQALFQSWFVDFDPVRAKTEGRPPVGLDKSTSACFSDQFQDSELGAIPETWSVGAVSDLVQFSRSSLTPANFPEEVFDHYSLPSFDEGRIPKQELGAAIKSSKFKVSRDAVLLSKLNPHIPRIWAPLLGSERRAICSTEFLVAEPLRGVTREYLYWLFTSDAFSRIYGTLVTGTTGSHQRINADSVLKTRVIIPTPALIEKFTVVAKPMLACISHNTEQSRILASLRDTILPKLLSGEISLS